MPGAEPRLASVDGAAVRAEGTRRKPKVLKGMRVERTADGGWHVQHEHTHYEHDRGYKFGPTDGLRAGSHISRHMGLPAYSRRAESETEKEMETDSRSLAQEEYS